MQFPGVEQFPAVQFPALQTWQVWQRQFSPLSIPVTTAHQLLLSEIQSAAPDPGVVPFNLITTSWSKGEFGISIDAIGYVLAAEVALALFPKTVKTPRRAVQILPSDAYPKSPALDLLKLSVKTLRTADAIVERFLNKNIVYAVKSPIKAQVLVALFTKLAADHCALSLAPGVAFTVTPTAPETVVCPKPV